MMKIAQCLLVALVVMWSAEALAAPPDHAPAHGWRKKHDPYYVGYTGRHWDRDFGILSGRCNREEIGTVVGGVIGGVIGSEVADRDDRAVATIIGAAVGALIGNRIGREMDEADRGCFAHALEVGKAGQTIAWENASTGVRYEMLPGDGNSRQGEDCRGYTFRAFAGERRSTSSGVACPADDGLWKIVQ